MSEIKLQFIGNFNLTTGRHPARLSRYADLERINSDSLGFESTVQYGIDPPQAWIFSPAVEIKSNVAWISFARGRKLDGHRREIFMQCLKL